MDRKVGASFKQDNIGAIVVLEWYDRDDKPGDSVVKDDDVRTQLELEKSGGFETESSGDGNGDKDI